MSKLRFPLSWNVRSGEALARRVAFSSVWISRMQWILQIERNLKNHIATVHDGHRAFLCDLCGKSFRLHATLMRHKGRNHNQKNLKKCSFCPAQFADNYKLSRHIRSIHSKEKPFKCDFEGCNKAFARKDKLQVSLSFLWRIILQKKIPSMD